MSDEIKEPTLKLCWNEHAIRRAAEVLRAAGLQLMAEDVEAQFPKPAIEEPREFGSIVKARDTREGQRESSGLFWVRQASGWFDDVLGRRCPWEYLTDVEVLRIGVGERPDVAPEETDDYKLGVSDTTYDILTKLRVLRSEAITSERKNAYDVAIKTVEAMQP